MEDKGEGSFVPIFLVMLASLIIAFYWEKIDFIKNLVHSVLDPTAGALLNWNLTLGMLVIVFVIGLITTLVQKYATDQKTLREMKAEQKKLQRDLKKLERGSKEYQEMTMKSLSFMGPMMKLSMRAMVFTGIPFILFFRWFWDFFNAIPDFKFLGFLSWFWFYLIFTIIFSSIFRKVFDVV